MDILNIVIFLFIVYITFMLMKALCKKIQLKEAVARLRGGSGVDYETLLSEKLILCKHKSKFTDCVIYKKDIPSIVKEILYELEEKFGENPFLMASKVDSILTRCKIEECTSVDHILEFVGIYRKGPQKINIEKIDEGEYSDIYECPRCKKKKHTMREVQKRSIDEASNVVCICAECGQKWDVG